MTDEAKPVYQHDCTHCVYLGTVTSLLLEVGGKEVAQDLYVCPQRGYPTVIARYSSFGPDYISGICFVKNTPALRIALERAIERNLIYPNKQATGELDQYKWNYVERPLDEN